jgi:hypothetical protein
MIDRTVRSSLSGDGFYATAEDGSRWYSESGYGWTQGKS